MAILALMGAGLILVAAVGILRMPDLYSRMQAASKAAPLGLVLLAAAAAIHIGGTGAAIRAGLIGAFLCLTAPIAAHTIARAGYRSNTPLADEAVIDELRAQTLAKDIVRDT